ncbi:hypothetical protein [Nonomuraea cavernae]|uniref:DUF2637 domain-containing protein n=1 Tax=Nonomuraea cavernae TaxID=2045107 RepID=A0A918DF43_9ACTN|nr:hypothetical protein [Nonomuraea cavernae]MCA2184611.1 hypothetical protein [Nonomuraea cavernae]GGO63271.1 hypothetical protein GCM10012289_09900 [Nonomuraea cavernae]
MTPSALFGFAATAFAYITANPISSAVIAAIALAVLVGAFLGGRALFRIGRRWWTGRPTEDAMTIVAASIATGVSAQGMWRFSGDVLGFSGPLQLLLFAFIEVAMVTSAVRARRNMRENHKAGVDGLAVWALTCLSAVLSSMDSASFPEAVFRLAAPIVAAWLWERGMAIERQRLTGRTRINWRMTPERMLVRVGLAESSDRTATEVDTHRRLTRVALTAKKARALREAGASGNKQARALAKLDKAMDRAVEHTGLVQDPAKQKRMLAQIAALYNTAELTKVEAPAFWQQPKEPSGFDQLALETSRMNERLEVRGEIREARDEMNEARTEIREAMANLVPLVALATGGRVVGRSVVRGGLGGGDTVRGDTGNGASGGAAPAPKPPVTPRVTRPVSRAQKTVSRKQNGLRRGTPTQPSREELERRIKWLHDLAKTNPDMDVTDLRDKAVEEYGVSTRTAYRYIEQAGLAPSDTDPGDTPRDTAGDASDGTARDTPDGPTPGAT